MRAIRILKEVDLVLAEDTRTSGVLLKHFDIRNQLLSHHKFNEHGTSAGIVNRLLAGQNGNSYFSFCRYFFNIIHTSTFHSKHRIFTFI